MKANILKEVRLTESGYHITVTVPEVGKLTWEFEFAPNFLDAAGRPEAWPLLDASSLLIAASAEADGWLGDAIRKAINPAPL